MNELVGSAIFVKLSTTAADKDANDDILFNPSQSSYADSLVEGKSFIFDILDPLCTYDEYCVVNVKLYIVSYTSSN